MLFNQFTKNGAAIIAVFAFGTLFSQTPSAQPERTVIRKTEIVKQPSDLGSYPDVIHPKKYPEIIPQIYDLKSTPLSVVLRVGQEFSIPSFRVQALGKDQSTLGTLTAYNTQLRPGAYRILGPLKITGSAPGTGEIVITPPLGKTLITDRPVPELRIVVTVLE